MVANTASHKLFAHLLKMLGYSLKGILLLVSKTNGFVVIHFKLANYHQQN